MRPANGEGTQVDVAVRNADREDHRRSSGDLMPRLPDSSSERPIVAALLLAGSLITPVAAQVPATLNGPPVQVQPYAPEPGVPLQTVNPGTPNPFAGATDPSAGSGSGSSGTSGSVGSGTGTSAGSTGDFSGSGTLGSSGGGGTSSSGFIAVAYSQYLGQPVGSGQCVALVQAADPAVGNTSTWVQGDSVQGNTSLATGTIIATFGPNGTYTSSLDGSSHAAIYLGQNAQGIQVEDQWVNQPAQIRTIPWSSLASPSVPVSNGSNYYVVSHAS